MASDLFSSGTEEDDRPISAINVTPFVDVVLVLLVIFMVTAPLLMQESIGIHLPKAASSDRKLTSKMGVAVTRQGQILLNGVLATPECDHRPRQGRARKGPRDPGPHQR